MEGTAENSSKSPTSPSRISVIGSAFAAVKSYFTPERPHGLNAAGVSIGITPLAKEFAAMSINDTSHNSTDSFRTSKSAVDDDSFLSSQSYADANDHDMSSYCLDDVELDNPLHADHDDTVLNDHTIIESSNISCGLDFSCESHDKLVSPNNTGDIDNSDVIPENIRRGNVSKNEFSSKVVSSDVVINANSSEKSSVTSLPDITIDNGSLPNEEKQTKLQLTPKLSRNSPSLVEESVLTPVIKPSEEPPVKLQLTSKVSPDSRNSPSLVEESVLTPVINVTIDNESSPSVLTKPSEEPPVKLQLTSNASPDSRNSPSLVEESILTPVINVTIDNESSPSVRTKSSDEPLVKLQLIPKISPDSRNSPSLVEKSVLTPLLDITVASDDIISPHIGHSDIKKPEMSLVEEPSEEPPVKLQLTSKVSPDSRNSPSLVEEPVFTFLPDNTVDNLILPIGHTDILDLDLSHAEIPLSLSDSGNLPEESIVTTLLDATIDNARLSRILSEIEKSSQRKPPASQPDLNNTPSVPDKSNLAPLLDVSINNLSNSISKVDQSENSQASLSTTSRTPDSRNAPSLDVTIDNSNLPSVLYDNKDGDVISHETTSESYLTSKALPNLNNKLTNQKEPSAHMAVEGKITDLAIPSEKVSDTIDKQISKIEESMQDSTESCNLGSATDQNKCVVLISDDPSSDENKGSNPMDETILLLSSPEGIVMPTPNISKKKSIFPVKPSNDASVICIDLDSSVEEISPVRFVKAEAIQTPTISTVFEDSEIILKIPQSYVPDIVQSVNKPEISVNSVNASSDVVELPQFVQKGSKINEGVSETINAVPVGHVETLKQTKPDALVMSADSAENPKISALPVVPVGTQGGTESDVLALSEDSAEEPKISAVPVGHVETLKQTKPDALVMSADSAEEPKIKAVPVVLVGTQEETESDVLALSEDSAEEPKISAVPVVPDENQKETESDVHAMTEDSAEEPKISAVPVVLAGTQEETESDVRAMSEDSAEEPKISAVPVVLVGTQEETESDVLAMAEDSAENLKISAVSVGHVETCNVEESLSEPMEISFAPSTPQGDPVGFVKPSYEMSFVEEPMEISVFNVTNVENVDTACADQEFVGECQSTEETTDVKSIITSEGTQIIVENIENSETPNFKSSAQEVVKSMTNDVAEIEDHSSITEDILLDDSEEDTLSVNSSSIDSCLSQGTSGGTVEDVYVVEDSQDVITETKEEICLKLDNKTTEIVKECVKDLAITSVVELSEIAENSAPDVHIVEDSQDVITETKDEICLKLDNKTTEIVKECVKDLAITSVVELSEIAENSAPVTPESVNHDQVVDDSQDAIIMTKEEIPLKSVQENVEIVQECEKRITSVVEVTEIVEKNSVRPEDSAVCDAKKISPDIIFEENLKITTCLVIPSVSVIPATPEPEESIGFDAPNNVIIADSTEDISEDKTAFDFSPSAAESTRIQEEIESPFKTHGIDLVEKARRDGSFEDISLSKEENLSEDACVTDASALIKGEINPRRNNSIISSNFNTVENYPSLLTTTSNDNNGEIQDLSIVLAQAIEDKVLTQENFDSKPSTVLTDSFIRFCEQGAVSVKQPNDLPVFDISCSKTLNSEGTERLIDASPLVCDQTEARLPVKDLLCETLPDNFNTSTIDCQANLLVPMPDNEDKLSPAKISNFDPSDNLSDRPAIAGRLLNFDENSAENSMENDSFGDCNESVIAEEGKYLLSPIQEVTELSVMLAASLLEEPVELVENVAVKADVANITPVEILTKEKESTWESPVDAPKHFVMESTPLPAAVTRILNECNVSISPISTNNDDIIQQDNATNSQMSISPMNAAMLKTSSDSTHSRDDHNISQERNSVENEVQSVKHREDHNDSRDNVFKVPKSIGKVVKNTQGVKSVKDNTIFVGHVSENEVKENSNEEVKVVVVAPYRPLPENDSVENSMLPNKISKKPNTGILREITDNIILEDMGAVLSVTKDNISQIKNDVKVVEKIEELKQENLIGEIECLRKLYHQKEKEQEKQEHDFQSKMQKMDQAIQETQQKLLNSKARNKQHEKNLSQKRRTHQQSTIVCQNLKESAEKVQQLVKEIQPLTAEEVASKQVDYESAVQHGASAESAFIDVHSKFENLRSKIPVLKQTIADSDVEISDLRRQAAKIDDSIRVTEATSKAVSDELSVAMKNEIDKFNIESTRIGAQLRKAELVAKTTQESLDKVTLDNDRLSNLCDDIIAGKM